ncbi:hypothetical protein [Actinomadura yumaensis]|uniref:DUF7919 domain-containing protein n=1 Tax=Actinomadura yumaensis TaxID=111807 RepID=A0ABW2CM34_9ACTN
MTYFEDLTPYRYWPNSTETAVNIGWLGSGEPFPTGDVPAEVVPALLRLVAKGPVNLTRGFHKCEFCAEPPYPVLMHLGEQEIALGNGEVRVTGENGTVYAAPTLLPHYIQAHRYQPPEPFTNAVLAISPA